MLSVVEPVFIDIVREISHVETVLIVTPEPKSLEKKIVRAGAVKDKVRIFRIDSNDTWSRDFGPITVLQNGEPLLLDFGFNGWGLKFAANLDNRVTRQLREEGAFCAPLKTIGLILEGGSIESDGKGTILTTAECLLEPNRNPHLSQGEIEEALGELLGADRFLWLENGFLAGDDTDSHVDTLARLCPDDTIAYVRCDDPTDEHYPALSAMEEELGRFRSRAGAPYRLIPLPWPSPRFDAEGERLPATYANFLVINGTVLVPTYRDKNDAAALSAIGEAFPGRTIIGIDCLPLILQHGSLHCVTMQLPRGVLLKR
jgi:agmatine deiminase